MNRIEINVITGEETVIELTAEEIQQINDLAEINRQQSITPLEPTKAELMDKLLEIQNQLNNI